MSQYFGQPTYDANGRATLCTKDSPMGMHIEILRLPAGKTVHIFSEEMESALLLLGGEVVFSWEGRKEAAARRSLFSERAWCLHIGRGTKAEITAKSDAELLIQRADNERCFPARLYRPEDNRLEHARYDVWDTTAKRDIVTLFDYQNAPYSNLVLGEIFHYPGRWSSYPPHSHPQPEVYYYRFDKPQGFGACFIGDEAYKIRQGSYAAIPGGLCHPQVVAPGYRMYYVWMIRHLPGNPWTDRIDDPDHSWIYNVK